MSSLADSRSITKGVYCIPSMVLFAWVVAAPASAPGETPTIYRLGPQGTNSVAFAVNPFGQVVGKTTIDDIDHTFLYTSATGGGGTMVDLGTLGGTDSEGYGINSTGQVVGESDTASGTTHAFAYIGVPGVGGTMVDLNNPDDSWGVARGINNSGQIVGSYTPSGSFASHAFLYNGTPRSDGMRFDLGTLGGPTSIGYAISPNGLITGWSLTSPGGVGAVGNHAFIYSGTPGVNGKMTDLGTLGGSDSYGVAINASGQVVGNSFNRFSVLHAFLYTGAPQEARCTIWARSARIARHLRSTRAAKWSGSVNFRTEFPTLFSIPVRRAQMGI